jgi:hypothetical protein
MNWLASAVCWRPVSHWRKRHSAGKRLTGSVFHESVAAVFARRWTQRFPCVHVRVAFCSLESVNWPRYYVIRPLGLQEFVTARLNITPPPAEANDSLLLHRQHPNIRIPGITVNHLHHVYVYMLNASHRARAYATNEVAMTVSRLNTSVVWECCGDLAGKKANPTTAYPLRL